MKYLIVFTLFFFETLAFAQAGNENISYSTGNFFMRANRPTTLEYVIDGNPYINSKEFKQVTIPGYSSNVQNLRYNGYVDEMEFEDGGEIYYTNKEDGLKITFKDLNKIYHILNYSYDNRNRFGYLVLLGEFPETTLYKREKVELLKGEKSPSAFGKDANDYYAKERDLYLVKKDSTFFKFPKNTKEFTESFSVNKADFDNFVRTNKLNFTKEEDILKMMNYINHSKSK